MNREIKEIRIKNNWENTNNKNQFGEKIYQLTNNNADISILSYRRYIGPYRDIADCNNEYTNIVYDILISPKIDKTKIKGEFLSEEWKRSISEIRSKTDFNENLNKLNSFLNRRRKEYDIAVEFKDINDDIFFVKNISSFSDNEISFTEKWEKDKNDFQILECNNLPNKKWNFSVEKYGDNFIYYE